MITKTIILKEAKLPLPKSWRGSEILMRAENDMLVVKRILKSSGPVFDEQTKRNLELLGKRMPAKTIREAVRWAQKR